jgi:hypothetical protein
VDLATEAGNLANELMTRLDLARLDYAQGSKAEAREAALAVLERAREHPLEDQQVDALSTLGDWDMLSAEAGAIGDDDIDLRAGQAREVQIGLRLRSHRGSAVCVGAGAAIPVGSRAATMRRALRSRWDR